MEIAEERPRRRECRERDAHRNRHEYRRPAIGDALHRRFLLFGFLHEADKHLERRIGARLCRADGNGAETVHRAGIDLVADGFIHRKGFACHRALIHRRRAFGYHAIDGDGLAGQDAHAIARLDLLRRHIAELLSPGKAFRACHDIARRRRQERDELADPLLRAPDGPAFELFAKPHDEGDFARREILADRHARHHRYRHQERRAYALLRDKREHRLIDDRQAAGDERYPRRIEDSSACARAAAASMPVQRETRDERACRKRQHPP